MLELIYQHLSVQTIIWIVVAAPLAGALANGALALGTVHAERVKYRMLSTFIGTTAAILSFAAVLVLLKTLMGFEEVSPSVITGPLFRWAIVSDFMVDVGLKVDQLSLVMSVVISGLACLVHVSSIGAMWHDEGYLRYFSLLNLFTFFMLLLVLADNLILLFCGWEGITLCSSLLIAYWYEDLQHVRAGVKAFLFNSIGDLGLLAGIFLIFGAMAASGVAPESGYFNFATMQRSAGFFVPIATALSALLLLAAIAKSAQMPLHVWLPDAMAAPTAATALVHAVAMVSAGVYLIVRLNFIFVLAPGVLRAMALIGAITAILAALMGLVATDIKKILAYSTISQAGLMFLATGIGAFTAAIFHMSAHACINALLFLAAGSVIAALGGEGDIRKMGGLKARMPITTWAFVIGGAALAGLAPISGFFSKHAILSQAYERGFEGLWVLGFLGSGITAFYIFRAIGSIFFGDPQYSLERFKRVAEPPLSMVVPMMLLITIVAFGGVIGFPECFGGSDIIGTWLHDLIPSELSRAPGEGSCGVEIVLSVLTLLWSAHFSVLGWLIYAQKRDWPERIARRISPIARLVERHFYVDELYALLILRPLLWFARQILWKGYDETVVDGIAVGGIGRTASFLSALASAAQNGSLQHYLLYLLIGTVLIIGLVVL